jgi:hypothetical protein
MSKKVAAEFSWVGSQKNYVDESDIKTVNNVVIGRFGGNSSEGQYKNEDGCLVWGCPEHDWEFTLLLDAHNTAQSAELVVDKINQEKKSIQNVLKLPAKESLKNMDSLILDIFQEPLFMEACRSIQGETACLIVLRKEKYIWWFSVGDCILHLFHPELTAMGEQQLNQRSFYEWVGQVNTFDLPVPCYSTGKKELRQGLNHLFLTTDGLTECPGVTFNKPGQILEKFENTTNEKAVWNLLKDIELNKVRDSTTIISWMVEIDTEASMPSDL